MRSEVPNPWPREPLSRLGSFHKGRGGSKKDEQETGVPVVRYGELYTRHHDVIREFHSFVPSVRAKDYTRLRFGDVLFAGSGETLDEIGKSAVFLGPEPTHASGDVIIFRPGPRLDPLFLGYASNSSEAVEQKKRMGQGSSVMHIYVQNLERLELTLPPLPEQKKIAAILSSVTEAIQATQAVIEQTRRVKEGLLQDLLTRGIGHTRFKQTEIGEIPVGWEVVRLGALYRERKEPGVAGLPVMSVTMHNGLLRRDTLDRRVESELEPSEHALVRAGDLVYNTMRMWQGASGVASGDGMVSPAYVVASPNHRIHPNFAAALFKAPQTIRFLLAYSQGITSDRLRLYFDLFKRIPIPLPPLREQERISAVLSSVAHFEAKAAFDLGLSQIKRGLLQDLLTGKVRVSV